MQKNIYTTSYYLLNQQFVDWVKKPTPELDQYWQKWIVENPGTQPVMDKAKTLILDLEKPDTVDSYEIVTRVKSNIDAIIEKDMTEKETASLTVSWNRIRNVISIAASITILFVAGWFLMDNNFQNSSTQEILSETKLLTRRTEVGQKLNLNLPDGTEIKLNSLSELRFPENFNTSNKREVYLKGEAYFDVVKNPDKPFVIHSENFQTTVLGTSFNIKSYASDNNVSIAVSSGKVEVKNKVDSLQKVILTPSEMLVFEKAEKKGRVEIFDQKMIFGWKDGILVFDKATFKEILEGLNRWYGVQFEVNKQVKMKKGFSGTFENESLVNVLKGIGYSLDFKYEIKEDIVIIN